MRWEELEEIYELDTEYVMNMDEKQKQFMLLQLVYFQTKILDKIGEMLWESLTDETRKKLEVNDEEKSI